MPLLSSKMAEIKGRGKVVYQLSFGKSLAGQNCKAFHSTEKATGIGGARICTRCGNAAWKHEMTIDNCAKDVKTVGLMLKIFCWVRNTRILASPVALGASFAVLRKALENMIPTVYPLRNTKMEGAAQLFESLASLSPLINGITERHGQIRLMCCLDVIYYHLFYCLDLHWRSSKSHTSLSECPVPPPHTYFSTYLVDPTETNLQLKDYILHNFSPDYRAHIARIWGLSHTSPSDPDSPPTLPFANNPLLQLHFSRWVESVCLWSSMPEDEGGICRSVSALQESCGLPPLPGHDPPTHATMKMRGDPLLPPHIRMWNDSCRTWACHLYAYCTPNPEAIDALLAHAPLLEVGAGTGYWAYMLRQEANRRNQAASPSTHSLSPALVIEPFDKDPPSVLTHARQNSYHGRARAWTAVRRGDVDDAISCPTPSAALLLCYPPPDSDMALRALRRFTEQAGGRVVCYVGEMMGDTGTRKFERLLDSALFQCVSVVPLPNWGDTCYGLSIWTKCTHSPAKNLSSSPSPHPIARCAVCGKGQQIGTRLHRCRFSYSVVFCSSRCAGTAAGRTLHRNELAFRFLLLDKDSRDDQVGTGGEATDDTCQGSVAAAVTQREMDGRKLKKKNKKRKKLRRISAPAGVAEDSEGCIEEPQIAQEVDEDDLSSRARKISPSCSIDTSLSQQGEGRSGVCDHDIDASPPLIPLTPEWFTAFTTK